MAVARFFCIVRQVAALSGLSNIGHCVNVKIIIVDKTWVLLNFCIVRKMAAPAGQILRSYFIFIEAIMHSIY